MRKITDHRLCNYCDGYIWIGWIHRLFCKKRKEAHKAASHPTAEVTKVKVRGEPQTLLPSCGNCFFKGYHEKPIKAGGEVIGTRVINLECRLEPPKPAGFWRRSRYPAKVASDLCPSHEFEFPVDSAELPLQFADKTTEILGS